jgi:hypothetical protein
MQTEAHRSLTWQNRMSRQALAPTVTVLQALVMRRSRVRIPKAHHLECVAILESEGKGS